MRTAIALLAASTCIWAAESKEIHRTLPLDANGRLSIESYSGSIRVTTWDRAEVDFTVRIEEADGVFSQPVRDADLRVSDRPSEIELESRYHVPQFFAFTGARPLFHYTVRMPRTARLRIKDYKSDTEIDGLAADLELDTYKGTVRIHDLAGALLLNTYKGDVKADFVTFNARSSVETYKGDIELRLPRNAGFDLRTDLDRKADLDSSFNWTVRTSSRRGGLRSTDPVNGGGPVLALKSYKGYFRLGER